VSATGRGFTGTAQLIVLPRIFVGASSTSADGGLDLGRDFSCGLIPLGRVYCWGANGSTQLAAPTDSLCFEETERGGGTSPCTLLPLRVVPDSLVFTSVTAGDGFACGISLGSVAFCWGNGAFGKLGNGHNGGSATASLVTSAVGFGSLTAGGEHACGLSQSGAAYCWGLDSVGQLGDARHVNSTTPVPVLQPAGSVAIFASISAGYRHTCALQSDGAAYCWGRDSTGELGIGSFANSDMPVSVAGGLRFTSISAGGDTVQRPPLPVRVESHTCAIAVGGAAYCWGSNRSGQLGTGNIGDSSAVPVPVVGGLTFSKISAGSRHTCGLTTSGTVYCWGRNFDLQLGHGGPTGGGADSGTPQQIGNGEVPSSVTFTNVSAGTRHSCAIGTDGNAYCWGSNVFGALGNTLQAAFRGFPQKVATPK
jgi:alpha-tubulin suppressor-like RCC1 family protein